jgi:serpin B
MGDADAGASRNGRQAMRNEPQEEFAMAGRRRIVSPPVTESDLADLVSGNSAFAWDLYQVLRGREGNLFYSPTSISLALAMAHAGARGETEEQMAQALHFALDPDLLHPAFNRLDLELARRGKGQGRDGEGFRLAIVNAIWGQQGTRFLADFLDILAAHYGAGMRLLDFAVAPERCRAIINAWASDHTGGKIRDLIPPGAIDLSTRLILTNAVTFRAAWSTPFKTALTGDDRFFLLDGSESIVPMMNQTESFAYVEGSGYRAVELPYDGWELSMVILLPEAGGFESFEAAVNARQVEAIVQELSHRRVALTMPRFLFASGFRLGDTLAAMGMPAAFSEDADFSGMTGKRDLFLSDVIHKAFVSVDEEGTEAAAATAAVMVPSMAPRAAPIELRIDHPFIFLIRDIKTGAVLFAGRVVDPAAP